MEENASHSYIAEVARQQSFLACIDNATAYSPFVYPLIAMRRHIAEIHPELTSEKINDAAALNVSTSLVLHKLLAFVSLRVAVISTTIKR